MLCGHISVFASNSKFASQEYLRAHRLSPSDPWPLLCLGASLLSLGMSRVNQERQFTLLKAFAVLSEYSRCRNTGTGLISAEIHYNLGRAFHQLSLWPQADAQYREALKVLQEGSRDSETQKLQEICAYNLHLIRVKNGQFKQAKKLVHSYIIAK
jgi:general transcription factor 3C polypeptide 3 (transcription factor C subunit 4)